MLKFLIFLQLITLIACHCLLVRKLVPLKGKLSSSRVLTGLRLVDCIDECLTNRKHGCDMFVFNHLRETCKLVNGYNARSCRGCVTMQKLICPEYFVDFQCFEPTTTKREASHVFFNIQTEGECRRICVHKMHCTQYTWSKALKRCGVHKHTSAVRGDLNSGEISAKKMLGCDSNRCIIIKINVSMRKGHDDNATSPFQCFERLLQNNRTQKVLWNYDHNFCQFHSQPVTTSYFSYRKTVLAVRQRQCIGERPKVCTKKTTNTEMEGGFRIFNITEKDCVTLCLNAVNCAALTWSRDHSCRFHHVTRKIISSPNSINYVVEKCGDDTEGLKGAILTTYYTRRGSNPTPKHVPSCSLECALTCQRRSCPGFRCGGQWCIFGNTTEHYIREN